MTHPVRDKEKRESMKIEKWNENIETCEGCGIEWKKIGKQCPVCYGFNEKDRSPRPEGEEGKNG